MNLRHLVHRTNFSRPLLYLVHNGTIFDKIILPFGNIIEQKTSHRWNGPHVSNTILYLEGISLIILKSSRNYLPLEKYVSLFATIKYWMIYFKKGSARCQDEHSSRHLDRCPRQDIVNISIVKKRKQIYLLTKTWP